jgi:hypothetical protein
MSNHQMLPNPMTIFNEFVVRVRGCYYNFFLIIKYKFFASSVVLFYRLGLYIVSLF